MAKKRWHLAYLYAWATFFPNMFHNVSSRLIMGQLVFGSCTKAFSLFIKAVVDEVLFMVFSWFVKIEVAKTLIEKKTIDNSKTQHNIICRMNTNCHNNRNNNKGNITSCINNYVLSKMTIFLHSKTNL